MSTKKLIYGVYDDPDAMLNAVIEVKAQGANVLDCFTPFPIHGLEKAMGIRRSNLTIGAFICGSIGFLFGVSLQVYTSFFDWPMIIGGKPFLHVPTYIPVVFECTILFTAFGLGILFFIKSRMLHGVREDIIDLRQTDDLMIVAIEADHTTNVSAINNILSSNGAIEIRERENVK